MRTELADEPTREMTFPESLVHQHEWLVDLSEDPDPRQRDLQIVEACLLFGQELMGRCLMQLPPGERRKLLPAYQSVSQSMVNVATGVDSQYRLRVQTETASPQTAPKSLNARASRHEQQAIQEAPDESPAVNLDDDDLVGTGEIARMFRLSREYVTDKLVKRYDFPKPAIRLSRRLVRWRWADVEAFRKKTVRSYAKRARAR